MISLMISLVLLAFMIAKLILTFIIGICLLWCGTLIAIRFSYIWVPIALLYYAFH